MPKISLISYYNIQTIVVHILTLQTLISVNLARLVGILHILCRGWGSNHAYLTSPQLNCVSSSH